MKISHKLLALILAAFAHQATAQTVRLFLPETSKEVTLTFKESISAHGTFQSVTIASNGKRTSFTTRNPLIRVPESAEARQQQGIWIDIAGLKLHSSRFFLVGSYKVDSHPHTLLFFLGKPGIGAAPVFVIGFSDDGRPFKILERNELDVTALEAQSYGALIIGKTSLSEVMGGDGGNGSKKPYATTYDPYSVYELRPSSPAVYSLAASRTFNQKHYVWAGPNVRDDYAVMYNIPGHPKPFGAPGSRVDSLLGLTGAK